MQTWKLAVLVGAATATAVGGAAVAFAGGDAGERGPAAPASVAQSAPGGSPNEDEDRYGAPGCDAGESDEQLGAPEGGLGRGTGEGLQELLQDPELRADLEQLRDEARAAIDDWRDRFGDDPASDEARAALEKLWAKQRAAVEKLMEKYGIEWGDRGPGHGAGQGADNDRPTSTATTTAAAF